MKNAAYRLYHPIFAAVKSHPGISLVMLLAAAIRVFACFFAGLPHLHTDTFMYLDQAGAILKGSYINYAPNGYPFIIAVFEKLFSPAVLNVSLLWLNVLFGVCTVYFVYSIALHLFRDKSTALIAAFILAIYPNQINYTRWLLTEIPSTFAIMAAYTAYIKHKKILSGILTAVAGLIRPTLFPVWLFMLAYDWIKCKRIPFRILVGGGILLLLTAGYCYRETGEFSIAGNSTVNLVYAVYSFGGDIAWDAPGQHPEIKTSAQAKALYIHKALEDPVYFIKQRLASLWALWGPLPDPMGGTRSTGAVVIIGLGNIFLLLFGIYGFIKNYRRTSAVLLMATPVILTAIHTMTLSIARYTIPAEPVLIIFTAWSCRQLYTYILRGRRSPLIL